MGENNGGSALAAAGNDLVMMILDGASDDEEMIAGPLEEMAAVLDVEAMSRGSYPPKKKAKKNYIRRK